MSLGIVGGTWAGVCSMKTLALNPNPKGVFMMVALASLCLVLVQWPRLPNERCMPSQLGSAAAAHIYRSHASRGEMLYQQTDNYRSSHHSRDRNAATADIHPDNTNQGATTPELPKQNHSRGVRGGWEQSVHV